MVKRYGQTAGIAKDLHSHLQRHQFATDLYLDRETKNIHLVQKASGQRSLSRSSRMRSGSAAGRRERRDLRGRDARLFSSLLCPRLPGSGRRHSAARRASSSM
jgi:hypothetical protein